jgi:hypothetical protein
MYRILHNSENPEASFYEIEEELIIFNCTEHEDEETNKNIFEEALNIAHSFRVAGLNPIYFMEPETNTLYVTSEEKLARQLH